MNKIKERPLEGSEGRENHLDEAQEIYETRKDELLRATKVKIEQALWIREKPSEEQVKLFNNRLLWTINQVKKH